MLPRLKNFFKTSKHSSALVPNIKNDYSLNADKSTKKFLDKINILLDTYAPLKRVKKYKLKFKSKPWITLGLQKSISMKNKLLTNFINKKDPILKYRYFEKNWKILRTHGKKLNPSFL